MRTAARVGGCGVPEEILNGALGVHDQKHSISESHPATHAQNKHANDIVGIRESKRVSDTDANVRACVSSATGPPRNVNAVETHANKK